MKQTTMTTAAALVLGASAFAATPRELVSAGNWTELVKTANYTTVTNVMPAVNVKDVYDAYAGITNWYGCAFLARDGYVDAEQAFNDVFGKEPLRHSLNASWNIMNATKSDEMREKIVKAYVDSRETLGYRPDWGSIVLMSHNSLTNNEALVLKLADYALAKGDYATAASPLFFWSCTYGSNWSFAETETLKAWRDANAPAIMSGLVPAVKADGKLWSFYARCLFNLSRRDLAAGDKTCSCVMQFFVPELFGNAQVPVFSSTYLLDTDVGGRGYTFGIAQWQAYIKNTDTEHAAQVFSVISKFPAKARAEELNKNWSKIEGDALVARKAALLLKDNDKLLDALVKSTNDMTADEINAVIAMAVAFDADYRAVDVLKVLKNINSKYTLKLYDDRDTWEPILSKVRALIDTRL